MLVLSQNPGDVVHIGDDITITTLRIGPSKVRYGITAPKHITILRDELLEDDEPETEGNDQ